MKSKHSHKSISRSINSFFRLIYIKSRKQSLHKIAVLIWLSAFIFSFGLILGNTLGKPPQPTALTIGETTNAGTGLSVTVKRVYQDRELASKMHLPSDQRLMIVEASITNRSDQDFTYLPSIQTYIRDGYGDTTTIFADIAQPALPAGPLASGKTIDGKLAYIIGLSNVDRWIYFDFHYQNSLPVLYTIPSESI